jgi:hypothetical protein
MHMTNTYGVLKDNNTCEVVVTQLQVSSHLAQDHTV